MAKQWLYLPVEVKVRELDAKLLLAYYAAKQGYRVVIGEHKMVELATEHYPPGIFFSKGYPKRFRKRIISSAVNHRHKVVELDEEGLIIHDSADYLKDRMQADMLQLVSQAYYWGPYQKELITNSMSQHKENYFITGSPRFDLLTPKFQSIYEEDANYLREMYGSFILVNTRFSLYNSILGRKTNNEHARYIKTLYDHFINMIHTIAKQFPQTTIVIRPHPSEYINAYKKEFASQKNIHIIHEGNIVKWLLAASVMIHHGCTSSIEAFLLDKPIISFVPVTSKKFDIELPNRLGKQAKNIEELIHLIQHPSNLNHSNIERIELMQKVNKYCRWSPSDYAFESIVSLLKRMELPRAKGYPPSRRALYRKEHKQIKHFFPHLHLKEIDIFFQKLATIEKQQNNFVIRHLGKNVFSIERQS